MTVAIVAEILMYFSDGGWGNDYWRFLFPAFGESFINMWQGLTTVIGSVGAIFMFMAIGVNLIVYCPPEMSGVAGAWNQVVAQTGGTIALAVQAGLEGDDLSKWRTVARGFWFELAAFAAVAIAYAVFYKTPGAPEEEHELARERIQQVLDNLEQKKIGKNEAV